MALDPRPGERVLDLAAAPGGKTSFISQLMSNVGLVVSNDVNKERHRSTVANLHRLGISNVVVCCSDGRQFPGTTNCFDRALLDAPCSGLGIVARDHNIKAQRTIIEIRRLTNLQKELILRAIDSVDASKSAVIVYSTCSITIEENEGVVQYALEQRFVRLIEAGLDGGRSGYTRYQQHHFHPSMSRTRRFFPHVHNMDGFFVAKLVKLHSGRRDQYTAHPRDKPLPDNERARPEDAIGHSTELSP